MFRCCLPDDGWMSADRCKNSEGTRQFYEDFIGLPVVDGERHPLPTRPSVLSTPSAPAETLPPARTAALHIKMGEGDDQEDVLHTFFQFDDGSCIAFFDAPDRPFDWKEQMDLVRFYKTLFYSLLIHLQGLLSSSSITFG